MWIRNIWHLKVYRLSSQSLSLVLQDTIHVYNTVTFETLHVLKGHQGQVTCVSWSLDDLKLVSCAENGSLYEWNVATGEEKLLNWGHSSPILACLYPSLSIQYNNRYITGDRVNEIVVKTCSFSYLTQSPDAKNVYAVGSDKTVKHLTSSRIVQEIDLHSFVLSSICLSNNGKTLVSGSTSGAVQLFSYPLRWDYPYNNAK